MKIIKTQMKYYIYSSVIYILLLASCTNNDNYIQQQDIDFVESFKTPNKNKHLAIIDSVLKNGKYNEGRTALLHLKKGTLLSILERYNKSIVALETALIVFKKNEDKKHLTKTYWMLGNANAFLSNKVLSNKQLLTALQYSQEINDKKSEANIYGSLSQIHYLFNDFEKSINYTNSAIQIYETLKDTLGLSSTYNNLAIIYKNIGNYDDALNYNIQSLELNIALKDSSAIAKSHNNIGSLALLLNNYSDAKSHFLEAISINKKIALLNSTPLKNLGDLYLNQNNLEQAETYYLDALAIENKKSNIKSKLDLNDKLLEISLKKRDFQKAIVYQKERDALRNEINIKDNEEKRSLLKSQYQLSQKKQELKQIQNINKKNRIIFLSSFGFLLLLTILIFQQGRNRKLKNEKQKIILEQKVLRSQMNPHFIFNVLSSIQNSLMDNNPIKSATYLSNFAKLFRQNFDFIDKKKISLRDEIDVLENYISAQKLRYKDKFEYQLIVSDSIDLDATEIPPLILQPFLENAIEHGFKNKKELGKITLTITKESEYICYEIVDNGKGFDTTKKTSKTHALDIFIKRLKLLQKGDEKSFEINSSNAGTQVKFKLQND